MSSSEQKSPALIDALRADLPDRERKDELRERLIAQGVIAASTGIAASASASAAALGSKTAASTSFVAKLGSALASAKLITAAVVVTSAAALPWLAERPSQTSPADAHPPKKALEQRAVRAKPPRAKRSAEPSLGPVLTTESAHESEPSSSAITVENLADERELRARTRRARSPLLARNREGLKSSAQVAPPARDAHAESEAEQPSSTLARESELLAQAALPLRAGELARARALLGRHAGEFPNGALKHERELALRRLLAAFSDGSTRAR